MHTHKHYCQPQPQSTLSLNQEGQNARATSSHYSLIYSLTPSTNTEKNEVNGVCPQTPWCARKSKSFEVKHTWI